MSHPISVSSLKVSILTGLLSITLTLTLACEDEQAAPAQDPTQAQAASPTSAPTLIPTSVPTAKPTVAPERSTQAISPTRTPTPIPTPIQSPVPSPFQNRLADSLKRRAEAAYEAFNQDRWDELYGYLTHSVQRECTEGQFAAWMQSFMKDLLLVSLEASLSVDEKGYTGFVEEAGVDMNWEVDNVRVQGEDGQVYTAATLSRLGRAIRSLKAKEPDRWKLVDEEWRWELYEPESTCAMIVNVPTATPTSGPAGEGSGYAWSEPAGTGVSLDLEHSRRDGVFAVRMAVLEVVRGEEAWQRIKERDPLGLVDSPYEGFEYLLTRVRVEYLEGPDPDSRYRVGSSDFYTASSDGRYYEQAWTLGAEPSDPPLDATLGQGQSHEGWAIFMVAVDDDPLLTYKTFTLDDGIVATPRLWWKLDEAAAAPLPTAVPVGSAQTLLYEVDFEPPEHISGEGPAARGEGCSRWEPARVPLPIKTVSGVDLGTPVVASSFGDLDGQALLLDSYDHEDDSVELCLEGLLPGSLYVLEADLFIERIEGNNASHLLIAWRYWDQRYPGSSTVLPNGIYFKPGGNLLIGWPSLVKVGNAFSFGTSVRLRMELDIVADAWQVFLDGRPMIPENSTRWGKGDRIRSILIRTLAAGQDEGALVGIDNIRVTALTAKNE